MFEYNGTQYTLAQVEEAASKTDMSLEDYISKYNITKIEKDNSTTEVGSSVNKNETGNKPIKTSVRGTVRKREVEKKEEKKRNEAQDYYSELEEELKNIDPKDTDSFFKNTYFDLANIPTKPVPAQTFGYGAGGTTNEPIPIQEYLGPEKFKQYEQFLEKGSAGVVPINEDNSEEIAQALTKAKKDVRKQTSTDFLNNIPTDIKNIMPNSAGEFKSVEEATESLKLISKGIDFQKEDYEKNKENFKKQDEEFAGRVKNIESQLKTLTNDEGKLDSNSSPETITEYQNLVGQYKQLTQEYEKAGLNKLYNDLIVEGQNINSSIEDFRSKLKEANLEDRKVIEDALKLDYTFGTRAGIAIEDFFAGGLVNTALLTGQVGVRAGELIRSTNFLNLWGTDQYDETQYDEAVNFLKTTAQNYNAKLAARREETIPEAYTLDDLKREEVSGMDWFSNALADNFPSIITTLATGGTTALGRAGLSTATTFAARRVALQTAKKTQQYGLRTAQGIFFTAETGGKYGDIELSVLNAEKQLPFLKARLAKTEDLEERSELKQQIEDLETKTKYTLMQKAFTSYGAGTTATVAETFGSLRFVQGVGSSVNQIGRKQFKKEFYENGFKFTGNLVGKSLIGLGKTGTRAGAINLIEEGLTLVGQNTFDRYVLKENKSLLEGLDKDFIASTLVTSIGMFAPRAAGNLNNLYKNEFQTRENVLENQELVGELIKIYTTKKTNGLKGKALRDANKRQNEIIKELGLNDALNLHKIRYLSEEEIREVGDLNRRIHEVQQEYRTLGKIGDPRNKKNQSALDRLNTQLNELVDTKESILHKGKKQHRETIKILREKYGAEFRQARSEYYLGVNNWAQDVAMLLMPEDGEFTVIEDEKGLENLINKYKSEEAKKKIREGYNQGNYAFNINNDIIIFQENTYRGIGVDVADSKYAAISPLEELFHIYNKSNNIVDENGELSEQGQFAVNQAINTLVEKKELGRIKISDEDYNNLIQRFELYKDKKGKKDHEELLAQLNNAVGLGILDLNDFTNMPSLRQLINGISNDIFGDASWMLQMNSSDDVFKFIQKYQQNIKSEVSIEGVEEEDDKIKESKEDSNRIDALVGPKKDGKYTMTKDEWNNTGINKAYNDLIIGDGLEKLINKGIFGSTVQGKSREEFVRGVKDKLTLELIKFNPEINNSLSGYINSVIGFRKGDTLKKLKKDKTTSLDKDNSKTGKSIAANVADPSPEPNIETPKQVSSKLRKILGFDTKRGKEIARNVLKGKLPAVTDKKFTTAVNQQARDEYLTEIRNKLNDFSAKQKLDIVNTLPLKDLVKLERLQKDKIFAKVVKDNIGPIEVDKAIAEGKLPKGTNRLSGPKLYERLPVTATQVSEFFGPKKRNAFAGVIAENLVKDALPEVTTEPTSIKQRAVAEQSQGRKTTDVDRANILSVIDRDPGLKFSKAVENILNNANFDLGVKDVNALLNSYNLPSVITIKNKKDIPNYIEGLKEYVFPLLPKQAFFGPSGGTAFTSSSKILGTGFGSLKDADGNTIYENGKPKQNPVWAEFTKQIKALKDDKSIKFGEPIDGVTDFKIKSYKTLFNTPANIRKNIANGEIKKFNDKVSLIHKALWERIDKSIRDTKKKSAPAIATYLRITANDTNHWHKQGANFIGYSIKPKGITNKEGKTTLYEYEHAMPATAAYMYLLDVSLSKGNFKPAYDAVMDNYKLIALDKAENAKLGKAKLGRGMPKGWQLGKNFWWERYFNTEVAKIDGGISPSSIINLKGKTFAEEFKVDAAGQPTTIEIENSKVKASKFNNKSLPLVVRLKGNYTNQMVLDEMAELDKEQSEAQIKFSKGIDLSKDFNRILENETGIGADKVYSDVKAQVVGANKGKFNFFIPPSAEDFVGLLYKTLGKGKVGDAQMAWYKKHLLNPFARAMDNISRDRVALMNDYVALKKDLKIVPKNLKKKLPGEPFTQEQAVRTYIWNKQGMTPEGMSKKDIKDLTDFVESKPELVTFADQLIALQKGDKYPPPKFGWLAGNITTDLMDGINTIKRAKYLEQWNYNVEEIFTKNNLNKLEAAYGKDYRLALESMLKRMRTGRNREFTSDSLTGRMTDWLTNSIGAIMFFNTRSAVLQTISAVNFINFKDNNIFAASKAFANQPQYWKDFKTLFNSDFLVDRRNGLRLNVNESDIADMAKKGGVRGVISELLKLGFLPTQIADSFAISSGGATFYRNRIKSLQKQGMSKTEAEQKAFEDFRETAEESQQSSRPDRISMQQAGPLGRVILAFANTPAQYARLIKKAASDLKNGRGDAMTNISKIFYYGVAQNIIFNALQQALFGLAFDDEEEDDKKQARYANVANGMADSILRGLGVQGAIFSVLKNTAIKLSKESDKKSPKYQDVLTKEIAQLSPPISSKLGKLRSAGRAYSWNKKEMMEKGFSLDNPAYLAAGQVIAATTNIPLDRAFKKIDNIRKASSSDYEAWARIAMAAGWSDWELGVKKEKPKTKIKSVKKKKRKKKKNPY